MENRFFKFLKKHPLSIIVSALTIIALICLLVFFLVNTQLPTKEHKILLSDDKTSGATPIELDNIVPGQSEDYIFVVTNTSKLSLNGILRISATDSSGFAENIMLSVVKDGEQLYKGGFNELCAHSLLIGVLQSKASSRITFTVIMPDEVTNEAQGGRVDFDILFEYANE